MLESFYVSNFRLFQQLEVKRLNRVNLIVGKNNAGKSTFLEALEIYVSNASPRVLLDLVKYRQETWLSEAQPESQNFPGNYMRHLFFGHKLPQIGEKGIVIGERSSSKKLHIVAAAYQFKSDGERITEMIRMHYVQLNLFDDYLSDVEKFLVVEEGENTRRLFRLGRDMQRYGARTFYEGGQESDFKSKWQIVATDNMSDRKLAALWDLTSLTDLESEVISALKLIDSRVSGVTFVEDINPKKLSKNNSRIPLVKLEGIDEPLPLKSMGDGMTRLFHIIVALVNAKNGLLLIDEFENGLHWSVQSKVWDIIFQISEKLNVQVFATTHSRDCVKGFDSAWEKYPELGAFFRLNVKDGQVKATEYAPETLADAIDMDVEVR